MGSRSDAKLELHLLGHFAIRIRGRDLPQSTIEGRKARSLLKLLALQRNFQLIRDQATDVLWDSLSASSAAAQLYKAIHHIRKAFSTFTGDPSTEDWIDISDEVIRLRGDVTTDVMRFEEASRKALSSKHIPDLEYAASLYAGDLLPMDLYNDWTALSRNHLRQLYLDVLLALGEQYQNRDRLAHAAETFRLALEKDPLLESAHRNLMRIFALQGQTTRAVRQYETCQGILRDELDAEPEAETTRLYKTICERRIAGFSSTSEAVSTLSLPALVNRVEECRLIEAALERLDVGRGGVVFIDGSVGVGKTRFAQELAARGRHRGFRILSGRAREMEGSVAYGPFIEVLTAAINEEAGLEDLIPQEIARSIPAHVGNGQPVPNTDRRAAQGYLFAQITEVFKRYAVPAPVVLILEDLHAADDGTLELFHYIARQTVEVPLLVAATFRSDLGEASERIDLFHRSIARETEVCVVSLAPLDEQDHVVLLEQLAARDDMGRGIADSIYQLSEGNPLFAIELYRFHGGDGSVGDLLPESIAIEPSKKPSIPPSLVTTVEGRLETLSPGARHLLYLMAVLGRDLEFELLETVWHGGESAAARESDANLFDLLDELRSARLIEEHGLRFRFRHALFRASIYQSISEARRVALHRLAARSLLSIYPDEAGTPVEQVAFHFGRAGDARQAAHYLTLAGERAESVYAHEDALRCYKEALDLLRGHDDSVSHRTCGQIYRRIGDVYRASGRLEQSHEAYEKALDLLGSLHVSRSERADLHLNIALVAIFRTEMAKSEQHLDAAWKLVESDEQRRVRVLILKALHLWHLNKLEEAYRTAHEALDVAESIGASLLASQACEILAMACLPLGRWEEGLAFEKRRQIHGWSPDVVVATDAHLCLWEYHVSGDRPFEEASAFMHRVSQQAERLGDYRCVAVCHYALGTMHLWRGDAEKAGEELDASLELHGRVGSPAGMAYALARKAVMYTVKGALDQGWEAVCEGIEHASQAAVRDHCLQRLYGIGLWNRLEANDGDRADGLVADAESLMSETKPCSACALELYPWLAFYYIRRGDIKKADACSRTVSSFAEATGNPVAEIISTTVTSSIRAVNSDHEIAGDLRRRALELVEENVAQQAVSPVTHFLDRMLDLQKQYR